MYNFLVLNEMWVSVALGMAVGFGFGLMMWTIEKSRQIRHPFNNNF